MFHICRDHGRNEKSLLHVYHSTDRQQKIHVFDECFIQNVIVFKAFHSWNVFVTLTYSERIAGIFLLMDKVIGSFNMLENGMQLYISYFKSNLVQCSVINTYKMQLTSIVQ